MTTLTIPYTLEDDNGALAPDYKPEVSLPMEQIVDLFDDVEASEVEDEEVHETLLEIVREHFVEHVSATVTDTLINDLVKQVRAALVARDSVRALPAST